ncbi:DUF1161 domain-containing protein [Pseudorhodoferax sp. Leaf267]|uniref:DUF1161 domain-containing protein n=1 Tax=Pseudorhodoferax sp. Leaf267 TaxID=1736316 RepID=UPI0006F1F4C9|nr:DUF1161 domain-containing protein [Pseudorhodoferax sp. Leaf267]KQP14260.1 hypothetical protein ASF43_15670 [Pseudorhodoferax sp. Leaf267]
MKLWFIPLAGLLAGTAFAQDNCEALRTQIEGRIREAGLAQFSVTVLEADQSTAGRIVGTCAMGKKKIAYVQQEGAAGAAPRPSVLTECRDGSTPVDGRCKK